MGSSVCLVFFKHRQNHVAIIACVWYPCVGAQVRMLTDFTDVRAGSTRRRRNGAGLRFLSLRKVQPHELWRLRVLSQWHDVSGHLLLGVQVHLVENGKETVSLTHFAAVNANCDIRRWKSMTTPQRSCDKPLSCFPRSMFGFFLSLFSLTRDRVATSNSFLSFFVTPDEMKAVNEKSPIWTAVLDDSNLGFQPQAIDCVRRVGVLCQQSAMVLLPAGGERTGRNLKKINKYV